MISCLRTLIPLTTWRGGACHRLTRAENRLPDHSLEMNFVVLIQVHVLQYAYAKLGLSSGAALLLLFASLVGSYFNIPLTELPEREVRSGQVVEFFGMRYVVPVVVDWPRTVIAVNAGAPSSPPSYLCTSF